MARTNQKPNADTPQAEEREIKPQEFKRGKALVVPSLSIKTMEKGDSLYVKFVSEPVTKKQTTTRGETKKDPETSEDLTITTAQVIDLSTGAIGDLVLSYMVCKGLAPLGEISGKSFELVKGAKNGRTIMWEVYELNAA